MTRIVDPLHSACLSKGFAPVKEKSTPTKLIFVNAYDEKQKGETEPAAELPAAGIHKDEIEYSKSAETLTDKRWTATSNVPVNGEYTWGSTPTTIKLAEKASEGSVPVFQYYKYAESSNKETNHAASTLEEKTLVESGKELSSTTAREVAAVVVTFRVAPNGRKEVKESSSVESGVKAEQSTLTTFSFMVPNSESTINAGPCE
jgi:hypothetical protein